MFEKEKIVGCLKETSIEKLKIKTDKATSEEESETELNETEKDLVDDLSDKVILDLKKEFGSFSGKEPRKILRMVAFDLLKASQGGFSDEEDDKNMQNI